MLFNILMGEDSSVIIFFPKTLVQTAAQAFWIVIQSTAILVIFTKSFSLLFGHEKLMFDWSSTCSGVKVAAWASHSHKMH